MSAPLSFRLLSCLPLPLAHALGIIAGWLLWLMPNKHRDITRLHIERCFPELSAAQQRSLARRSLRQAGKALCEGPVLWAGPASRVERLVREIRGRELLDAALQKGRGVITAAPHLGSWEMAGLACSRVAPMTSLYKTQKGDWDALIKQGRERFGATLVPSDNSGVRKLLGALKRGEIVGILPDQDPPVGSGEFAPFFGIQAHSPVLLTRLARRTGATVLTMHAERLSWGRGYILHFAALEMAGQDDEVAAVTTVNSAVEYCVRQRPEQYWWAYPRYRRRPAGENDFYAGLIKPAED
ncbi:MAG: lysophospholipid acyltransferase family protein [Nevskiales bacterium]